MAKEQAEAAAKLDSFIARALEIGGSTYKFEDDRQREEVIDFYGQGQAVFKGLCE